VLAVPALFTLAATAQDDKPPPKEAPRYGFSYNDLYSQKSPKDAIQSVVKAIDARRVDYLLAQIAEPKFVDGQVAQYRQQFTKGKDETQTFLAFDKLVSDTVDYFLGDPILIKELRLFARDGMWDVADDVATGTAKGVPSRKVFFKRIGERWFLENKQQ
jgi:hypothetical protein